jgi:outer membrane lipase/esterase
MMGFSLVKKERVWSGKGVLWSAFLALLLLLLSPTWGSSSTFTRLVVFGDSLSDSGNHFLASGELVPAPPYYKGRYADGPNYVDRLAESLKVDLAPFLAGGMNFAFGGARTTFHPSGLPFDLISQVVAYKSLIDESEEGTLFIVFAGGNDMRDAIRDSIAAPDAAEGIGLRAISTAIDAIYQTVRTLAEDGGQNFLIPNLPNLGRLPETTHMGDEGLSDLAQSFTLSFNEALESLLEEFQTLNIIRVDTFALMEDIVADPSLFGLKKVRSACYTGQDLGIRNSGMTCPDPETFLFWDFIHPSSAAHEILAEHILVALHGTPVAKPETIVDRPSDGGKNELGLSLIQGSLGDHCLTGNLTDAMADFDDHLRQK